MAAAIYTEGAEVVVHDPRAMGNARESFPHLAYAESPQDAVAGADAVLLLTEWRDYLDIDPASIAEAMRQRVVVDARNALDVVSWRYAGFTYRGLGRPSA